MIRQEYKDQLQTYRGKNSHWGSSASKNCDGLIYYLNRNKNIQTVLDFGCGNGVLGEYMRDLQRNGTIRNDVVFSEYDPSVPGKDLLPDETFDLIVSLDVMEHIEPCSLDDTLDWLCWHSLRQYHHIDCNETTDRLPDGRDVHLIIEQPDWWQVQLQANGWGIVRRDVHDKLKRGRMRRSCTFILERQG